MFSRRQFLQSALYSSLIYGAGFHPRLISTASAAPEPLEEKLLINLFLDGGPDFRHLIVPAYDADTSSFGYKYWSNRWRAHQLSETDQNTWQQRWSNDYYPITVGGAGWNGQEDIGGLNAGITFGIWREASWLIDMFNAGHVALSFNVAGGTDRAHDQSTLILNQGNVLSGLNDADRSGWGGRLARSAGLNSVSLTSSPSAFNFGPLGAAPGYDPNSIDNIDLISVENSREMGLFDFSLDGYEYDDFDDKMARAAKSYYAGLRQEQVAQAYQKFLDHELKVRQFGELIQARLQTVPEPTLIEALHRNIDGINIDPNDVENTGRRVLRSSSFGRQIRNVYDIIAANDLLNPGVMSLSYGGWDSHGNQREIPAILASDPNNPFQSRGIESGFKDIFGGQFGGSPFNSDALHGGFSALWENLEQTDRNKIVITIAGEFGRQIRDNGDAGTDHGKGNLMLVISESCQGGIYGEMFPDTELPKYDEAATRTPDIDVRTEIDPLFASVANWVASNSSDSVFPRTAPSYQDEAPLIEVAGMFDNLMV